MSQWTPIDVVDGPDEGLVEVEVSGVHRTPGYRARGASRAAASAHAASSSVVDGAMTVQVAGPIGPFLDSVQQRQVECEVVATCEVSPPGPASEQRAQVELLRVIRELTASKMASGTLQFKDLSEGADRLVPEVIAASGLAQQGIRVDNLDDDVRRRRAPAQALEPLGIVEGRRAVGAQHGRERARRRAQHQGGPRRRRHGRPGEAGRRTREVDPLLVPGRRPPHGGDRRRRRASISGTPSRRHSTAGPARQAPRSGTARRRSPAPGTRR